MRSLVKDSPDGSDSVNVAGVVGGPVSSSVGAVVGVVVGTIVVGGVPEGAAVVVVGVVGGHDGPSPWRVSGESGPDRSVVDVVVPLAEVVDGSVEVSGEALLGVGAPSTLRHTSAHVRLSVELVAGHVLGHDHLSGHNTHLFSVHLHLLHVLGLRLRRRHRSLRHSFLLLG